MKILLLTPPLTQLNTPYPATTVLKGYLQAQGHEVAQADLGIELVDRIYPRQWLSPLASDISDPEEREYLLRCADIVEPVLRFLRGQDNTLAPRIANRSLLPEGPRFNQLGDLEWAFGIAGTEDNCPSRYRKNPLNRSNIGQAVKGAGEGSFLVMLQHAPRLWTDSILGKTHAQLTLSGHTHGGQIRLFRWAPARVVEKHVAGLYNEGNRALYVSAGLSGLVPFRFGVPPEITVITLRRK